MIEFIFGFLAGIILLLFIAFVDDRWMLGRGVKIPETKFKLYLIASCWELLFFTGGFLFGRFLL
jgi:hypothetical protein